MKLPDAILTRVFQFATQNLRKDYFTYITVCMKWRRSSQQYPVLQFVKPFYNKIGDRGCLALSESCKSLRFLHLEQCDITDTGLRALAKLSSLFELWLQRLTAVTSDGLQALGALTQLNNLLLFGLCRGAEQHGINLAFVTKFKCLRELRVIYSKITDTGLAGLVGTSSLTALGLDGHGGDRDAFYTMPVLLRVMKHLHELQDLSLSQQYHRSSLIDVAKVVQTLPKQHLLRTLDLQGFMFDESIALAVRDGCTGLTSLDVDSCGMTDDAIRSHFCTTPSISPKTFCLSVLAHH